jgi:hypothetical protein
MNDGCHVEPEKAERCVGAVIVRSDPALWRISISQGEAPPFLFFQVHQTRHVVVGILASLRGMNPPVFASAIERVRQFLR